MSVSDSNFDELIKASAKDLIDEDIELLHSIDTSNTEISSKVIRRIHRSIWNYDKEAWWINVPMVCRRVVAAVMFVCTLSFGWTLSVTPVRAAIVNTFIEWYENYVSVFFVPEQTPPNVIEEYREPILQLSGSEKVVVVQDEMLYQILYMNDSEICLAYQQMLMTKEFLDIDRENCKITDVDINSYKGHMFIYDDGTCNIAWSDKEYSYILTLFTASVDQKTIIDMAESVK